MTVANEEKVGGVSHNISSDESHHLDHVGRKQAFQCNAIEASFAVGILQNEMSVMQYI